MTSARSPQRPGIGVDVGGTRIKVGVVTGGKVQAHRSIDTPTGAPWQTVLDAIAHGVLELEASPTHVGVAIPGEVGKDGRVVRLPNIPGFEDVPIARELTVRLKGARVAVENDATAAAWGEFAFGHGDKFRSFITITLGTGVGGGIVIDGHLVRGSHGFAGELGHVTIDSSSTAAPCPCGNRGCLEAYAGTHGILARFRAEGGAPTDEIVDVANSARRGEKAGIVAFEAIADALAIAINSFQNTLDVDAYVFSGGVSQSFDLVEPRLRAGLRARRFAPVLSEVPLVVSALEFAGIVGAAHLPELDDLRA